MEVRPFNAAQDAHAWNAFVDASRNGVFLFRRDYMDYHAPRFDDRSLMFFDRGRLQGLLPCHQVGDSWVSHGGLSFGGMVWSPSCGLQGVLAMFESLGRHLESHGSKRLIYTPIPAIYANGFAEDDRYALHQLGAQLVRTEPSTTVDLQIPNRLASGKRQAANKARLQGVELRDSQDFRMFWSLLSGVLEQRHGATPTHTVEEMEYLAGRFETIRLRCAFLGDEMLAGIVLFRYGHVLHTQYMASSPAGQALGALDALLVDLFHHPGQGIRTLNFGKSSTAQGTRLNTGLLAQKEMMGGRTTLIQTWNWNITPDNPQPRP